MVAGTEVAGVDLDVLSGNGTVAVGLSHTLASTDHTSQTTSIKNGSFGSLIFGADKKGESDNDDREADHSCPIIHNEGHRLVRAWRLSGPDTNRKQYQ